MKSWFAGLLLCFSISLIIKADGQAVHFYGKAGLEWTIGEKYIREGNFKLARKHFQKAVDFSPISKDVIDICRYTGSLGRLKAVDKPERFFSNHRYDKKFLTQSTNLYWEEFHKTTKEYDKKYPQIESSCP